MEMILPNTEKALHIIWELKYEMNNPRNDGWTSSGMKKRLWDIKMAVDKALVDAPEFHNEEAYEDIYIVEKIRGNL